MRITITLPSNRNLTGVLHIENDQGRVLCGPFPVSGRASDQAAAAFGNLNRSALLPYGDTPFGGYRFIKRLATGAGTPYQAEEFGAEGAIVLQGVSGDAALAEANGRFQIFLQGGPLTADGRLRATNGNLRVSDKHLKTILKAVEKSETVRCEITQASTTSEVHLVHVDPEYNHGDPPVRSEMPRTNLAASVSRRQFIHVATAAVAGIAVGGVSFLAVEQPALSESVVPVYDYGALPPKPEPETSENP